MNTIESRRGTPAGLPAAANASASTSSGSSPCSARPAGSPGRARGVAGLRLGHDLDVAARPRYDLAAMAVFATAGLVLDSAWSLTGAVSYAAAWPSAQLAPIWLVTLWAAFALTVGHSLAWLRPRRMLAALFGLLGGGFSYWVGARVGAVETAIPAWQYGAWRSACLGGFAAGADPAHRDRRASAATSAPALSPR
jgi:hypothetical protein